MKKMILFLALLITINIFGQDVNTTVNTSFYRDTLTTTIDTVQLKFQSGFDYYTVSIYTTTGTDTVNVYSKGEGNYGLWTQKALIDLTTNSIVSQIIITTTAKEYLLQDPGTMWLRLITPDVSASAIFTVNAKKGNYAINSSSPITLPLGTGGATATNQSTQITRADSTMLLLKNIYYRLNNGNNVTLSQAQIDSLQLFFNGHSYVDNRNSWDWARSLTTYIDTVKTDSVSLVRSRDTLTIGGSEWSKITIRGLASTDSLQFTVGTTAPATFQRVFGTTPFVTEKLNKTYFTKVFIKGYGANNSIKSYQVTIEAF
jgi:hypothetical protein